MFPLIISLKEIKRIIEEVKETLKSEGIPYKEDVEFGVIIEACCIFYSIGFF